MEVAKVKAELVEVQARATAAERRAELAEAKASSSDQKLTLAEQRAVKMEEKANAAELRAKAAEESVAAASSRAQSAEDLATQEQIARGVAESKLVEIEKTFKFELESKLNELNLKVADALREAEKAKGELALARSGSSLRTFSSSSF